MTAHLYRFLTAKDDSAFCHKVTKALNEGWVLYGDPQYSADPQTREMRCGQAVTKTVEDNYDPNRKLDSY